MKNKILIPLDAKVNLSFLRGILEEFKKDEVRLVALTYDVMDCLEIASVPHEYRERAADLELLYQVNPYATPLARTWHEHPELQDILNGSGINVGRLTEFEIMYAVNVLMDRWLNIREMVRVWKPDLILNLYPDVFPTELRIQHDESLLGPICKMLRQEFLHLKIESRISYEGNGTVVARKSFPLSLANRMKHGLQKVMLTLRNSLLFLRGADKDSGILFYSGWWYFLPVIDSFSKRKIKTTLLQPQYGKKVLQAMMSLRVYLELLDSPEAVSLDARYAWQKIEERMRSESVRKLFIFQGHDIWPLVRERFEFFWKSHYPKQAGLVSAVHRTLKRLKPGVIVTENDTTVMERTVVMVGNKLGIPTLVLQHGMTSGGDAGKSTKTYVDHAFLPLTASRIAVYGKITRDFFINKGIDPDRVKVTGCPRFDGHFLRKNYPSRDIFLEKNGIPKDKKIIVYANTPGYKNVYCAEYHLRFCEIENLTRAIIQTIEKIPEAHLVIKMKDRSLKDRMDIIERHLGGFHKNVSVVYDVDILTLLHYTDLFVGSWSTMCLEALIFKKPVVTINLTGRPDPMPFAELGGAFGVYREEDILPALTQMLFDEKVRLAGTDGREQFVKDYLVSYRGDGTERFSDLVFRLTRGQSTADFADPYTTETAEYSGGRHD